MKKLLLYEPNLIKPFNDGKNLKGITLGITNINYLNNKDSGLDNQNLYNKNNNNIEFEGRRNIILQKLNFKKLINTMNENNPKKKLNQSVENKFNNPIDSRINLNNNDNKTINNNRIQKNLILNQQTIIKKKKNENLENKGITQQPTKKKVINPKTNKIKNDDVLNNNLEEKNLEDEKEINNNVFKIKFENESFPQKKKNKYNPNNNPFNGKIKEDFANPDEDKEYKQIIFRFKLTEEEYKLLLREKAKLINPIENKNNNKYNKNHY